MSKNQFIFLFILLILPFSGNSQNCSSPLRLTTILTTKHLLPRNINDTFSSNVHQRFFESLYFSGLVFQAKDMEHFHRFELELDDQIEGASCEFTNEVAEVLDTRFLETDELLSQLRDQQIQTNLSSSFTIPEDGTYYPTSKEEKKQHLENWVRLVMLNRMSRDVINDSLELGVVISRSAQYQEEAIEQLRCAFQHMKDYHGGLERMTLMVFLECITKQYDPHTSYFSWQDMQAFEEMSSTESLTFGIRFKDGENGDILIGYLSPGGSAWRSNLLHENDLVEEIKFDGAPLALGCLNAQDLNTELKASGNVPLEISIANAKGQATTVTLEKQYQHVDENTIKSFLLKGRKKIGYVSIPSFYSSWDLYSADGVANDVAKEIIKLNYENIDGLIVDLRGNGGGSVQEAMDFAGIFINEGPLFTMTERDGTPHVLKDRNRGTSYRGPLVVMVDARSASASEILASTLQDYNRAVIVGGRTFGKATAQSVMMLDTNLIEMAKALRGKDAEMEYAKITQNELYRVDGSSNQQVGVKPDILLPDVWQFTYVPERDRPTSIPSKGTDKVASIRKLPPLPINELKLKHQQRLVTNTRFRDYWNLLDSLYRDPSPDERPMDIEGFIAFQKALFAGKKQLYDLVNTPTERYKVSNNSFDGPLIEMDNAVKETNEKIMEHLFHDLYIHEAYEIISDLSTLTP